MHVDKELQYIWEKEKENGGWHKKGQKVYSE